MNTSWGRLGNCTTSLPAGIDGIINSALNPNGWFMKCVVCLIVCIYCSITKVYNIPTFFDRSLQFEVGVYICSLIVLWEVVKQLLGRHASTICVIAYKQYSEGGKTYMPDNMSQCFPYMHETD